MTQQVFDVKFDGNVVKFYDNELKEFRQETLVVYCKNISDMDAIQGFNKVELKSKRKFLVCDAMGISSIDEKNSYIWYVLSSALKKANLTMNSSWNPAFIVIEKGEIKIDSYSSLTNIIITPNMETANILRKYNDKWNKHEHNILILPLIETITNVFPIHTGLTLMRIAITLEKQYCGEWMDNQFKIMAYLFGKFVSKFNELSQKEACSLSDLSSCLFKNTFRVSFLRKNQQMNYIQLYAFTQIRKGINW